MRTLRCSLIPLLALLLVPLQISAQDEDGTEERPAIELWQCQAEWSMGDTMRYEVRAEDRTFQDGQLTKQERTSFGLQVTVLDSGEAGYTVHWQRTMHDREDKLEQLRSDTLLYRLFNEMTRIELIVHTNPLGTMLKVDGLDRIVDDYQRNMLRFANEYGSVLDSLYGAKVRASLQGLFQNSDLLAQALMTDLDLFFSPFGLYILSDSSYTERIQLPNPITGKQLPGNATVTLKDVSDLSYHIDVVFTPDAAELQEQLLQTLKTLRRASKDKSERVHKRDLKQIKVDLTRVETFVINSAGGWPNTLQSVAVSRVGDEFRREVSRTISSSVFMQQPKNELYWEQMIQEEPDNAFNYAMRGYYKRLRGDFAGAEEDQLMALALRPDAGYALLQLAGIRFAMQRYDEALQDVEQALLLDSLSVELHDLKSDILLELYRFPEALHYAERSLELLPDGREARINKAMACLMLYRFPEAVAQYNVLLARDSTDWKVLGLRADAYKRLRTVEGDSLAQRDLERSLEIKPDNYSALISLGNFHLDRENYLEAIAVFDTVLAHSEDATALHNRGYARVQLGQVDAGIADLEGALDLAPHHSYAPNNLGWAEHLRGNNERALLLIEQAIERQPGNAYAHYNKGRVLFAMDRPVEACAALREAEDRGFTVAFGDEVSKLLAERCGP